MQNNEIKESIWADGVPQNVDEKFKVTTTELLAMGINYIVDHFAIPNGFKIEAVKPQLGVFPNVVLKRNDIVYSIVVVPFVYPQYSYIKDEIRLKMVEFVKSYNGIPLFAPIGFKSTDKERALASMMLKGDTYDVLFRGFIKLTDEEHQELIKVEGQFTFLEE